MKIICEKGKTQPRKRVNFFLLFISVDSKVGFSSMWFYNFCAETGSGAFNPKS